MHLVETELKSDGTAWLVVKETRDGRDVLAALLQEIYCSHEGPCARCLIHPPGWAYWVGGHDRFSLGGQMWRFGQWVSSRTHCMPEVLRQQIPLSDLMARFVWSLDSAPSGD